MTVTKPLSPAAHPFIRALICPRSLRALASVRAGSVGVLGRTDGAAGKMLSRDAWDLVNTHHWPGNVRQLVNALKHAMVVAMGDIIEPEDFPASLRDEIEPLQVAQERYLAEVLRKLAGDVKTTAELLGISERTAFRAKAKMRAEAEMNTAAIVTLDELKATYVARAVRAAGGNRAKAARYLGVDRATLREWERKPRDAKGNGGTC